MVIRDRGRDRPDWYASLRQDPALFEPLSDMHREQLIDLAVRFLDTRQISAAGGLTLMPAMARRIALQACLPILHLGLDWYAPVRTVILYPGGFMVDRCWTDEAGVEHQAREALSGEAWQHGPVVLAWDEIERPHPGSCVVIHEFTHVLDALNGQVNGFPPVVNRELARHWPDIFKQAYEDHCARVEHDEPLVLDAYACEAPEEFLAVACELFFIEPVSLQNGYPAVHVALSDFFQWPAE